MNANFDEFPIRLCSLIHPGPHALKQQTDADTSLFPAGAPKYPKTIGQIEIFSRKSGSNAAKWNLGPSGAGMSSPGSSPITDHIGAKAEALPEVCAGTSAASDVTAVAKRYPSRKDLENALIESRESEARLRR